MLRLPFSRTVLSLVDELYWRKFCSSRGWCFSNERIRMIRDDWVEWSQFYLPVSVKDKVVLDVGAGEGETALFYLFNGARCVFGVEPNKRRFGILKKNCQGHGVVGLNLFFDKCLLNDDFGLVKVDIEGFEESFLSVDCDVPLVCELHGIPLIERFRDAGWRVQYFQSDWCAYGYLNC